MTTFSVLLPYFNRKEYLKTSLDSFQHFYHGSDIEFVIVDDGSSPNHTVEDLVKKYQDLNIRLVRIDNKIGTNPSRPYNVAARNAAGRTLILSSPEIMHTNNIIEAISAMGGLGRDDYFVFSVFCPTEQDFTSRLLKEEPFTKKLEYITSSKWKLRMQTGLHGRGSFANEFGSWYLHSKHRPTHLNFLTAISAEKYHMLCGFDERFIGTGYDDNEFLDRVLPGADIRYCDDFEAIHINHPPVYGSGNPVSNHSLYLSITSGSVQRWGDPRWGL